MFVKWIMIWANFPHHHRSFVGVSGQKRALSYSKILRRRLSLSFLHVDDDMKKGGTETWVVEAGARVVNGSAELLIVLANKWKVKVVRERTMNFVTHFQMISAPLSSSTLVELYFTFFAFIIRSHSDSAGITHNYEDWVKARLCKFHPETSPEFRDLRSTDLFHIGRYYCILRRPLITNLIPSTLFFLFSSFTLAAAIVCWMDKKNQVIVKEWWTARESEEMWNSKIFLSSPKSFSVEIWPKKVLSLKEKSGRDRKAAVEARKREEKKNRLN